MTQEQILVVLERMRVNALTTAFKQWTTDHFYDDVVQVTEEEDKNKTITVEKMKCLL